MEKLLFITPELPYPPQSGGKVKSLKLLKYLSERFDVTLASPLKGADAQFTTALKREVECDVYLHWPVSKPRNALQLAASYVDGHPLNVRRTFDENLKKRVANIVNGFEIVVLDHYEVLPYLPRDFPGFVVYHSHNAYFKMWERFASLPGNPLHRAAAWLEASRVKGYEKRVADRASLVFAAPNDGDELEAMGVASDKIKETYHLGDDSQLALPPVRFDKTRKKLMYVGFLGWEPNVQGLLWFMRAIWPRLIEKHPDLQFDIVGKDPDTRLQEAVADEPNVRLLGFVENLETVYRDSRVSVAPLLFGSGMKVKVLDAMARGMPTATTVVGAEGLDVENGTHLHIARDAQQMVRQIDRLLVDEIQWMRLRDNSRELVGEKYTWDSLFRKMSDDMDQARRTQFYDLPRSIDPQLSHGF